MRQPRKFECISCSHAWEEPYGTGRPIACPSCGNKNIRRADEDKGPRRVCGGRRNPRGPSSNGRGRDGNGRGPRE